jgi:DNA-binding protein H-NS
MKSYDELKTEMAELEKQMAEAKKKERQEALKTVKKLCKDFGFTAGMLGGALAEGRKKNANSKTKSKSKTTP